ncbi:protein-disulfide reductase DsbD family protein [Megalodesulfovibrio paquesii]
MAHAQAQSPEDALPHSLEWQLAAKEDGSLVAVLWIIPGEGLYTYSHTPGLMGQPTTFVPVAEVEPPVVAAVQYPPGEAKPDAFDPTVMVQVYHEPTPVFLELGPANFPLEIRGELRMLFCSSTSCTPVREAVQHRWDTRPENLASLAAEPLAAAYAAAQAETLRAAEDDAVDPLQGMDEEHGQEADEAPDAGLYAFTPTYFLPGLEVQGLGEALLLAFLAGLLLNAMPCVLPVVSLKCSALLTVSSHEDRAHQESRFREHSIWFAVGIFCYFMVLGAIFGAAGLAWGELFQKPALVLGLAVVLFLLGLSLFGVFDLPMIDLKGATATNNPRLQAFSTGLLATLLATPCSGPLLGGVLAWTLSRSPTIILPVFLAIGLGMSLPYLLMARWPSLVRRLPKPGAWTLHLERGAGFLLMATTIYLVQILPESLLLPALISLWVAGLGAWMWGQWTSLSQSAGRRWSIRSAAVLLVAGALVWALQPVAQNRLWEPFDPARFQSLLGQQAMLVDFTADWCPNCKVLERTTLRDSVMRALLEQHDLILIRVDMTREDAHRMALLKALGSQSIPVVAVFPPGEAAMRPVVLRDLFTPSQLTEVLDETLGQAR